MFQCRALQGRVVTDKTTRQYSTRLCFLFFIIDVTIAVVLIVVPIIASMLVSSIINVALISHSGLRRKKCSISFSRYYTKKRQLTNHSNLLPAYRISIHYIPSKDQRNKLCWCTYTRRYTL